MVQIRQAIYIITPLPHPITASSPAYVLGERPRRAATLATPPPWWGCRIWPLLPSGRCVEDRSGGWRPAPSPCLPSHPTSSSSMSRRCGSLPRPRQAPPHMGGDLARPPLPYGRRVEAGSCAWRPTPSPRRPRAPPPPSQGMAAVVDGGHHLFLHDFVCPPPRCDPPGAVLVRPPRCGST